MKASGIWFLYATEHSLGITANGISQSLLSIPYRGLDGFNCQLIQFKS